MEGGYIALICRGFECINDLAKEVIDSPVDIHMKSADLLERLNIERKAEAVLLQFGLDPVIGSQQGCYRPVPALRRWMLNRMERESLLRP